MYHVVFCPSGPYYQAMVPARLIWLPCFIGLCGQFFINWGRPGWQLYWGAGLYLIRLVSGAVFLILVSKFRGRRLHASLALMGAGYHTADLCRGLCPDYIDLDAGLGASLVCRGSARSLL